MDKVFTSLILLRCNVLRSHQKLKLIILQLFIKIGCDSIYFFFVNKFSKGSFDIVTECIFKCLIINWRISENAAIAFEFQWFEYLINQFLILAVHALIKFLLKISRLLRNNLSCLSGLNTIIQATDKLPT